MNNIKYIICISLTCGALSLLAPGCSDDPAGPVLPKLDTGGNTTDLYVYKFDTGGQPQDQWIPKFDTGGGKLDGGGGKLDGGGGKLDSGGGDGTTACPKPSGTCSSGCPTGSLCTPAKGGMCAKLDDLTGPASQTKALAAAALAVLTCWNKQSKQDTLCSTFNTCKMSGTLNEGILKNYVCSLSKASDFSGATVHSKVKSAFGCGWTEVYRPEWKTSSITSGVQGIVCLTYHVVSWGFDRVEINGCAQFPPN